MNEQELAKPNELLALHDASERLFETFRAWFGVGHQALLNLETVDSAARELSDPVLVAAMAMRKLQAIRLLSTPGVRTSTDVVVAIINDLERAMLQAPTLRLRAQAASADWDSALAELAEPSRVAPSELGDAHSVQDPEIERFRDLHRLLHGAVRAVIEASDGEIRIFV